jgi:hypothetical protein
MNDHTKSLLLGAAVAAVLILPAAAGEDWATWPRKTFSANTLKVEDYVGTLVVSVNKGPGPITVDVAGTHERLSQVEIHGGGDSVRIEGSSDQSVWDWHQWFNFDMSRSKSDQLVVKVGVPKGTSIIVDDMVGKATIGDTYGPLKFEGSATVTKVGRVSTAKISLDGTGRIDVAAVGGPLDLDIAGSGKVNVGPTQSVKADIAGAGDTALGPIAGGLDVDIAGSGDISTPRVNGPVTVDIAGSGSVNIADGVANPLKVDIMGSGNFTFGGLAIDPKVSSFGSGSVKIKAYKGKMSSDGMASVEVGGEVSAAAARAQAQAEAAAERAQAQAEAAASRAVAAGERAAAHANAEASRAAVRANAEAARAAKAAARARAHRDDNGDDDDDNDH